MSKAAQQQESVVPPSMTLLRRAWDVDRFIVLGSLEKVVCVMFCSTFDQFQHGVRPNTATPAATATKTAAGVASERRNKDAEKTNLEYVREAAMMDATLQRIATNVRRFCTIYRVDTSVVRDYDIMYELHADEPFALMFYYRNRHIKVDVGTGNNNKINFAIEDEHEMIEIIDAVFVQAGKNNMAVVKSGKSFSDFAGRGGA